MPSVTSPMSAPTRSHSSAIALTYDSFIARKQFAAYLISSADAASVSTVGAPSRAYSAATRSAASAASHPTTIRSGFRKSCTAEPSRRNSGFDTTDTSARSSSSAVRAAVPTGTVDLFTTTVPGASSSRVSSITASTARRSATPPTPIGVGRHRNTTSASSPSVCSATADDAPTTNDSRPADTCSVTSSDRPGSTMSTTPRRNRSTFAVSMSAHTTWCPSDARHAPVVRPT